MEMISRTYDEAEKNKGKRSALQFQLDALHQKTERLMEQMKERGEALQDYIRSAGAKDDKDFEIKHRQWEKRKSLQKNSNEKRQFIQSRVGLGKAYEDFLNSIKNSH